MYQQHTIILFLKKNQILKIFLCLLYFSVSSLYSIRLLKEATFCFAKRSLAVQKGLHNKSSKNVAPQSCKHVTCRFCRDFFLAHHTSESCEKAHLIGACPKFHWSQFSVDLFAAKCVLAFLLAVWRGLNQICLVGLQASILPDPGNKPASLFIHSTV